MKLDRNTILWILIGALLLLVVYIVFFKGSLSTGSLAGQTGQAASRYAGMVGGC